MFEAKSKMSELRKASIFFAALALILGGVVMLAKYCLHNISDASLMAETTRKQSVRSLFDLYPQGFSQDEVVSIDAAENLVASFVSTEKINLDFDRLDVSNQRLYYRIKMLGSSNSQGQGISDSYDVDIFTGNVFERRSLSQTPNDIISAEEAGDFAIKKIGRINKQTFIDFVTITFYDNELYYVIRLSHDTGPSIATIGWYDVNAFTGEVFDSSADGF